MRKWFVVLFVAVALGAVLVTPPEKAGNADLTWLRDSGWLPRNAVARLIVVRWGRGSGHVPHYSRIGREERAGNDLRWLRLTEIYPPSHPGLYMESRRGLAYAYAAQGDAARAAARMLDAARTYNTFEIYGGTYAQLDWDRAVLWTYRAHGLESALEVWREGRSALDANEVFLEAAIEDGLVFVAEVETTGEPPEWWSRELDYAENPFANGTRAGLAGALIDDGDLENAAALLAQLDAEGAAFWDLTIAKIDLALARIHEGEAAADAERLADLTLPLALAWTEEPQSWESEAPYDFNDLMGLIWLNDGLGRCDEARLLVDALALSEADMPSDEHYESDWTRLYAWLDLSDACWIASLRGDPEASGYCARREEIWQNERERSQQADFRFDLSYFPAVLATPPDRLSCYSSASG